VDAQPELARETSLQQKGPVALLQEFVQSSRQFSAPQNRAILQWTYDQRMTASNSLEFRASVAFLLDGVPHHVAGGWCSSKKLSQRDVAERSLVFFVGKWGEQLLAEDQDACSDAASRRAPSGRCSDMNALEDFCLSYPACGGALPRVTLSGSEGGHVAQVELMLLGVAHTFGGAARPTPDAARSDVARRMLWYFQAPGYQNIFAPDVAAVKDRGIPVPPANWACSEAEAKAQRNAERKTALMRVQNRLQQHLAKRLPAGQSVWEWSYELDECDKQWPPLCRTTVVVPAMGETFVGPWARGQRSAQIEASYLVADFLDGDMVINGDMETSAPTSNAAGSSADSEETSERIRWADIED